MEVKREKRPRTFAHQTREIQYFPTSIDRSSIYHYTILQYYLKDKEIDYIYSTVQMF